jgi:hypothetical protein
MKRLAVDVVIVNERAASDVQGLQIALETQVRSGQLPQRDGMSRGGWPAPSRGQVIRETAGRWRAS